MKWILSVNNPLIKRINPMFNVILENQKLHNYYDITCFVLVLLYRHIITYSLNTSSIVNMLTRGLHTEMTAERVEWKMNILSMI